MDFCLYSRIILFHYFHFFSRMSAGIAIQRAVIASLFYRNSDTAQTFFIGAIVKWERTDGRQLPTLWDCEWECDFDHSQHYSCKTDSWAIYLALLPEQQCHFTLLLTSTGLHHQLCRFELLHVSEWCEEPVCQLHWTTELVRQTQVTDVLSSSQYFGFSASIK